MIKWQLLIKNKTKTLAKGKLQIIVLDMVIAEWDAVSGGWGRGFAPNGLYWALNLRKREDNESAKAFKKEGFPWTIDLSPRFETDRTNLEIHPDGNVPGTLGCVGITAEDLSFFYIARALLAKYDRIPFEVKELIGGK